MIHGSITQENLVALLGRHAVLARAFAWIRALPENPTEGITELDGRRLYVNVHGYRTREHTACTWESHRHTADLQYCLAGSELIDCTPGAHLVATAYDTERDFETWPDSIRGETTLRLAPGRFALFLPGEQHRPMIADGAPAEIRKLVVKIDAALLSVT